jgi:hypothetical protein
MSPTTDPILVAVARLETKLDAVIARQADHEKRLRWVVTAAVLVVGAIGGPDAVQLVTGAPA